MKENSMENNSVGRSGDNTLEIAEIGKGYFDISGERLLLDEVSRKIYETDKKELSYADMLKLYRTRNARIFLKSIREGINRGEIKFEKNVEIKIEPGRTRWIHVIGIPEYIDKTCVSIQFLFKDIDREVRENINLKVKSSILESSFINATEGLAIAGINGSFLQVNPALCQMLGYSVEELKTKKVVDFVAKEDLEELEMILIKFLTGDIKKYSGEKQYINREGKKIRVSLNITIIKSVSGVPLNFMFQLMDVTQMYHSQTRIESLLQLVADQNTRLLDFAYIVSHNLRSHTGNLDMLLKLLRLDFPSHTENNYFPMMKTAVGMLQQTIEDLNKAIVSYSFNEEELKRIPVGEVLNQVIEHYRMRINVIGGKVINKIPEGIELLHIESYLYTIFSNLIDNAIKYRDTVRPLRIVLKHSETVDYHIIDVQDNGLGIDLKTNYHKVFGMYKTFHQSKEARGIGLFLIKNQIEALKGKIEVESEVGEGTTFKLYFKK